MKKAVLALLILSLCLGLCACGEPSIVEVEKEVIPEKYQGLIDALEAEDYDGAQALIEGMRPTSAGPDASAGPVITVFQKEGDYIDGVNNRFHYLYRIPAFAGDSGDIPRLNAEIFDFVTQVIGRELEYTDKNTGPSLLVTTADYEYHVNGDIVSLLCNIPNGWGDRRCLAVSIGPDGRELSREEVLAAAGMDEESFLARAREQLTAEYIHPLEEIPEALRGEAEEINAKTLSEENLLDTQLFLNGEGRLSMVVRVYTIAGGGMYWHIVDL